MSFMIEVFYKYPVDVARERRVLDLVEIHGGKLTFHEVPTIDSPSQAVCMTIEFDDPSMADAAATDLRLAGEFIDGPMDYGDED
jgi:hypothetical protein